MDTSSPAWLILKSLDQYLSSPTPIRLLDEIDLADIEHLIVHEHLDSAAVRQAMHEAVVPEILRDAYRESCPRLEALLQGR